MKNVQAFVAVLGLLGAAGFSVGVASGPGGRATDADRERAVEVMRPVDTAAVADDLRWADAAGYVSMTRTPRYAVFFDGGAAEAAASDILDMVADEARHAPRVEITPIVDPRAEQPETAVRMAVDRAKWVRAELATRGITPDLVVVTGALPQPPEDPLDPARDGFASEDRAAVETVSAGDVQGGDARAMVSRVEVTVFKLSDVLSNPSIVQSR